MAELQIFTDFDFYFSPNLTKIHNFTISTHIYDADIYSALNPKNLAFVLTF